MGHEHDLLASVALFALLSGCAGDGCSCVTPIPGGFPDSERVPNAVQVRVSSTGLDTIEADPAGLVGGLLGGGGLTFDIPSSCGGDPEVCCSNGNPTTPCGPIEIDLTEQPGDAPRMQLTPVAGASQLDLVVRARVKTTNDFGVTAFGISCLIEIDTTMGGPNADIQLATSLQLVQDPDTGTTKVVVGDVNVTQFDDGDIEIKQGDFACIFASWGASLIVDTLISTFEDTIRDAISEQLCKQCPTGDVGVCGPHATACTDGVCMKGNECLQELGITGRLAAANLLGSFSPGTGGAIDIYDVAGGYATTDGGGVSLGILGGALPAGSERDRCGPSATAPAPVTIGPSSFFAGNTRPDTGEPFDFAFGMHQHHLDLLAYSAYESGFLCLNVSTKSVDLLTSETLALIFPSFVDLLHGTVSPIVLGVRPQAPPTIALGLNTYRMEGTDRVIDDPLLDISLPGLEIDFFGLVDDQWIRLMTLVSDVRLPINLDVDGNGAIVPVLGDLEEGFTNLSVKNSEALVETPAELADKFPALLSFAVPLIAGGLGGFDLPSLGGLTLRVAPDGITSVDDQSFLAIFGSFELGTMAAPRASTEARITGMRVPARADFAARRWDRARRPAIELELGGTVDGAQGQLEWSVRVDRGMWSPYQRSPRLTLSRRAFWLQGRHTVEVRARLIGRPETTDPTPVVLEAIIDRTPPRARFAAPLMDNLFVDGVDNVAGDRVRVEYRFGEAGSWRDAGLTPTFVHLEGQRPQDLQIRLTDSSGNQRVTTPVIGFHGSGGAGSGCECNTGGGPAGGLLLLLVSLGLLGRRRWQAVLGRWAAPLASLAAAVWLAGCSCGGDKVECFGGECVEGEVEYGPVGRWSDIAVSADRVVVSAYDQGLGDLVIGEVDDAGAIAFQAVDGVPDEQPVYDPSTYRGGITQPGADVGAWTSVALRDGRALVAYQDRERKALKLAYQTDDGWVIHDVDPASEGTGGSYASLSVDPGGVPAIAFMAVGVDDGNGGRLAQLRYAQASSPSPASPTDWAVTVIDEAPISCAGLCSGGTACVSDPAISAERCVAPSSDCAGACSESQTCSQGTCYASIPDPPAHDLAAGTGLFAQLLHLPDGRPTVVYYDRILGDLVIAVRDTSWTKSPIDAGPATDTGMWAAAVVDSAGTVHVAYQDALGDRLLYTTWAQGTVGAVEVVDDGTRPGDRAHHVGASAAIILQPGGEPAIVYQDGTTSDVQIARRAGGSWQRGDLLAGPNLYGFFINAGQSETRSLVSSYMYDRASYPPGELIITTIP